MLGIEQPLPHLDAIFSRHVWPLNFRRYGKSKGPQRRDRKPHGASSGSGGRKLLLQGTKRQRDQRAIR